ncbi:MAG: hypothetical protein KIS68_03455 [Bauldia sp.]|nr:hypothetical protein [Bauldia sp.]
MIIHRFRVAVCAAAVLLAAPALADECRTQAGMETVAVDGRVVAGTRLVVAAGPQSLVLVPDDFGWRFEVQDTEGRQLPIVVAPSRPPGAAIADLRGFSFRNAGNTGPSPPALADPVTITFHFGLSARDPLQHPELNIAPGVPAAAGADSFGTVSLRLLDYGLADLAPGERARMVYVSFTGCVGWSVAQTDAGVGPGLDFLPEEIEYFGGCGLDLSRYELSAFFAPRVLGADIDGDGAHDMIAAVVQGETRGVAVCRAGTYLTLLGFPGEGPDLPFEPGFLPAIEAWSVAPPGTTGFGFIDEPPWPAADGDVIVLERIEKAMVLLFMRGGQFEIQSVYRYVEP